MLLLFVPVLLLAVYTLIFDIYISLVVFEAFLIKDVRFFMLLESKRSQT